MARLDTPPRPHFQAHQHTRQASDINAQLAAYERQYSNWAAARRARGGATGAGAGAGAATGAGAAADDGQDGNDVKALRRELVDAFHKVRRAASRRAASRSDGSLSTAHSASTLTPTHSHIHTHTHTQTNKHAHTHAHSHTSVQAIVGVKKCENCGCYSNPFRKDGFAKIFQKPLPKKLKQLMRGRRPRAAIDVMNREKARREDGEDEEDGVDEEGGDDSDGPEDDDDE